MTTSGADVRYLPLLVLACLFSREVYACPFCSAVAPSLSEELARFDFVAIGVCTRSPSSGTNLPTQAFRIEDVLFARPQEKLAGEQNLVGQSIEAYTPIKIHQSGATLLLGVSTDLEIEWVPAAQLSPVAIDYVQCAVDLHKQRYSHEGSEPESPNLDRSIALSWRGLASDDEWVRKDAYNAVATLSIDQLRDWCKAIEPTSVRKRISTQGISRAHLRFYWTVLGLCGTSADAEFVRKTIERQLQERANNQLSQDKIGLDAAVSCYLLLAGEEALRDIERTFLQAPDRHDSELFAAITALRVHSHEFKRFERRRICRALALLLENGDIADQVIPDLARLEDWSHVSALSELFLDAQPEHRFLQVPIINYLRACPLPEAKPSLQKIRQAAPEVYRRAHIVFPIARDKDTAVQR